VHDSANPEASMRRSERSDWLPNELEVRTQPDKAAALEACLVLALPGVHRSEAERGR
jgi:hypothetical protein